VLLSVSIFYVSVVNPKKACSIFQNHIRFYFFKNNVAIHTSRSFTEQLSKIEGCEPGKPWLMMVHGFEENCFSDLTQEVLHAYTKYRGGCIACMDYSYFVGTNATNNSDTVDLQTSYMAAANRFNDLAIILTRKLQQFVRQGFTYETGSLYGMSFGSQLSLEGGKRVGGRLKEVNVCDPAAPFFSPKVEVFNKSKLPDYEAGQNVQCIHTSMLGTLNRDCHQDWLMGNCGTSQVAGHGSIEANHELCPKFYSLAFNTDYPAVDNECCKQRRRAANLSDVPAGYKMGYMQKDKGIVRRRDLCANTYLTPPYNKP